MTAPALEACIAYAVYDPRVTPPMPLHVALTRADARAWAADHAPDVTVIIRRARVTPFAR